MIEYAVRAIFLRKTIELDEEQPTTLSDREHKITVHMRGSIRIDFAPLCYLDSLFRNFFKIDIYS